MSKDFQIAHAWGKHCKNCKKIFGECEAVCPICGGVVERVMSAFKVPRGCIFVYDDGSVPGGQEWTPVTDEEYARWKEAVNHPRPGQG